MTTTTQPPTPTERDVEQAELIADAGFVEKPMHHISRPKLVRAIAAALAAREQETRAETWRRAIEVALKERMRVAEQSRPTYAAVADVVAALEAARNEGNSK